MTVEIKNSLLKKNPQIWKKLNIHITKDLVKKLRNKELIGITRNPMP